MRKHAVVIIGLILALGFMQSPAFAERGEGRGPGKHHQREAGEKFFRIVHMADQHQDELNVSDEQLTKLRTLKHDLQKHLIRTQADIDIIAMDIRALLKQGEVNVKEANALIDRKYDIKKENAKKVVGAFAELKKILTTDQMEKMKEIARERRRMHRPEGPPGMGDGGEYRKEGPRRGPR